MHKLYDLKEKLMNELEDYADNGKFSKDDVEAIKYTASAIDHICNIVERYDGEEGYSEAGMSYNPYNGASYAGGRGGNRGGNSRRSGRSSYAYSRAAEGISQDLMELAKEAPDDRTKREIHELANKLQRM